MVSLTQRQPVSSVKTANNPSVCQETISRRKERLFNRFGAGEPLSL
jgi:hypothetical protein